MNSKSQDRLLVIPHIPKTGGTSLHWHFRRHFSNNDEYIDMGPWGFVLNKTEQRAPWEKQSLIEQDPTKVIIGHAVCKHKFAQVKRSIIYACCLRDPAELWLSHFNYLRGKKRLSEDTDFFEFFDGRGVSNLQAHFLWHHFLGQDPYNLDEQKQSIIDELSTFALVGKITTFDEYTNWICNFLNIPNAVERKNTTGKDFKKPLQLQVKSAP